jgi:hypothetical protein
MIVALLYPDQEVFEKQRERFNIWYSSYRDTDKEPLLRLLYDDEYMVEFHTHAHLQVLKVPPDKMKYYGNYCGPNHPSDFNYSKEPVDEFDNTCRQHDLNYDKPESDQVFYDQNIGKGFTRTLGALAVKYPGQIYRYFKSMPKRTNYDNHDHYWPGRPDEGRPQTPKTGRTPHFGTYVPSKPRKSPVNRGYKNNNGTGAPRYRTPRKFPIAYSKVRRGRPAKQTSSGNRVVLKGTERIGEIGAVTPTTGDLLFETKLCPAYFGTTRLRQMALLYQRYRYKKLVINAEACCGTTTPGSLIGCFVRDPKDVMPSGASAANYVAQNLGSKRWPCYANVSMAMPLGAQGKLFVEAEGLYQYDDERLENPGKFVIVANDTFVSTVTVCVLTMDYEIEFWLPTSHWNETQLSSYCNFEHPISAAHPFTGGEAMLVHSSCNYEWTTVRHTDVAKDYFEFSLPIGEYFTMNSSIASATSGLTSLTWSSNDVTPVADVSAVMPSITTLDGTTAPHFYHQTQGTYEVTGPDPWIAALCVVGTADFEEAYVTFTRIKPGGAWVAPTTVSKTSRLDVLARVAVLERLTSKLIEPPKDKSEPEEIPEVTRPVKKKL